MNFNGYQFEGLQDPLQGIDPFCEFDFTAQQDADIESLFPGISFLPENNFTNEFQYPDPEIVDLGQSNPPYNPWQSQEFAPVDNMTYQFDFAQITPPGRQISSLDPSCLMYSSTANHDTQSLYSMLPAMDQEALVPNDSTLSPRRKLNKRTFADVSQEKSEMPARKRRSGPAKVTAPPPDADSDNDNDSSCLSDAPTSPLRVKRPVRKARKPAVVECNSPASSDLEDLFHPGEDSTPEFARTLPSKAIESGSRFPRPAHVPRCKQPKPRLGKHKVLIYDPVSNTNVSIGSPKPLVQKPKNEASPTPLRRRRGRGRPCAVPQTAKRQLLNQKRMEYYYEKKRNQGDEYRKLVNRSSREYYYRKKQGDLEMVRTQESLAPALEDILEDVPEDVPETKENEMQAVEDETTAFVAPHSTVGDNEESAETKIWRQNQERMLALVRAKDPEYHLRTGSTRLRLLPKDVELDRRLHDEAYNEVMREF